METGVGDAMRAAAAVAVAQEASMTEPIHLVVGLFVYADSCIGYLTDKGVARTNFESWHKKLREPMLTLEECTPEPSPDLKNLLVRFVSEGRVHGLLTEKNLVLHVLQSNDPKIAKYLKALKLDRKDFICRLLQQPETVEEDEEGGAKTPFGSFLDNLNDKAKNGQIHHIQGRQGDLQWLLNTLCQYRKKNAILIGAPGVGKTALIEELALLIHEGKVPDQLKGKTVMSLDVGSMVAGTKLRGQFEERMQNMLKHLKSKKDIILFVDEIHTIIGAGGARGNSLNAANMLKPALSRGEICCIGATTPDDVAPIEKDPAFKRRFQFRWLEALTDAETLTVLKAEAEPLGAHYGVTYTLGGLKRILEAANDYYPHQFNPDKSLTLADSVGSFTKHNLHQSVVNTKAVNASLRARQLKEHHCIVSEIETKIQLMFDQPALTEQFSLAVTGYLMQLSQPGVLVLTSQNDWVIREVTNFLAQELHNQAPLTLEGSALTEPDAVTQLKGLPAGYNKEPMLLDELHFAPHRLVYARHLDQSFHGFQSTLLKALSTGDLLENSGRKLPLRHTFFVISSQDTKKSIGYTKDQEAPKLKDLPAKATIIHLPAPRDAWVEKYLFTRMVQISDRVKAKIKVAYNAAMPKHVRLLMEKHGEVEALLAVEKQILKASQQQVKRLILTPEVMQG